MLRGLKEAKPKFPAVTSPAQAGVCEQCHSVAVSVQEKAAARVGSAGLFLLVGLTQ